MRKTILMTIGLLALFLSACAPMVGSPTPQKIDNTRLVQAPAYFYPDREGFEWKYDAPEGTITSALTGLKRFPLDDKAYETLTTTDATGVTTVRYFTRANGIQLVGEVRDSEYVLHYDPPMRLYPNERDFRPGGEWGGTALITEIMGYGTSVETRLPWKVTYHHEVIDRENIRAGSTIYDAYKIRYTADWTTEHNILTQNTVTDIWFAPFVGEIRTRDGYGLFDTNVNTRFHGQTPPAL